MTTNLAKNQIHDPRRTRLLSGVAEATIDVRKACNGIKRMSSLGVASMVMGIDPKLAVEAAQSMAYEVLDSIGFDVSDESRLSAVLPMMLEATAMVVADAAYSAGKNGLSSEALINASKLGVALLGEVAKSRFVSKMVEPGYPADMESVVALRLSAASAMANVAIEIAEFDYAHAPAECIREAGKVVVKAAVEASTKICPPHASSSARLMLTQSLIHSAARLYAATWRVASQNEIRRLDAMSNHECDSVLSVMGETALVSLLAPLHKQFNDAFSVVADTSMDLFAGVLPVGASQKTDTAKAAPRPSVRLK